MLSIIMGNDQGAGVWDHGTNKWSCRVSSVEFFSLTKFKIAFSDHLEYLTLKFTNALLSIKNVKMQNFNQTHPNKLHNDKATFLRLFSSYIIITNRRGVSQPNA